uniref:Uncharacterized protein n=1 Tax=OCS116 cluster bacterium TaxID=2030921 RepID=A0A2A4Z3Q6_9PROT
MRHKGLINSYKVTDMKKLYPLIGSLILFAAAYFGGLIQTFTLAHPWWYKNATLVGGAIGIAIALILIWYRNHNAKTTNKIEILLGGALLIVLYVDYTAGRTFIDSDIFEARAGKIWHYGYHTSVALFIPTAAALIRKFIK